MIVGIDVTQIIKISKWSVADKIHKTSLVFIIYPIWIRTTWNAVFGYIRGNTYEIEEKNMAYLVYHVAGASPWILQLPGIRLP